VSDSESETEPEPKSEAIAIDGDELDLHTFLPRDVGDAVVEYLDWAAERGLVRVRIIHGKGTGTLRRIVHAALAKHPRVSEYGLAAEQSGGWGATWVTLRPAPDR
jgi:dsDNA-specific endonuclease/ATPase MutS2